MAGAHQGVLDDLKTTAQLSTVNRFDVPLSYAALVRNSLLERGVELPCPERGSEMLLEFTSGHQLTMMVH